MFSSKSVITTSKSRTEVIDILKNESTDFVGCNLEKSKKFTFEGKVYDEGFDLMGTWKVVNYHINDHIRPIMSGTFIGESPLKIELEFKLNQSLRNLMRFAFFLPIILIPVFIFLSFSFPEEPIFIPMAVGIPFFLFLTYFIWSIVFDRKVYKVKRALEKLL